MKKTTIEWLEDAFFLNAEAFNGQWTINNRDIDRIIETAKEREKQQIIDAYLQGDEDSHYLNNRDRMGEGYYNETFKSK